MADGNFGERDIFIDLNTTGARVIRAAAGDGQSVVIHAIRINGDSHATLDADIILRRDSASGPIVFQLEAPGGTSHDGTITFNKPLRMRGLFMDNQTNAWVVPAHMMIHTN